METSGRETAQGYPIKREASMSEVTLGKQPGDVSIRDAIHVAVTAAKAREQLHAGDRVGFVDYPGRVASRDAGNIIGIVDPFRVDPVPPHGLFWLCLFPGSVTGMRHQWVHPEFPAMEVDEDDSEAWLRRYAAVNNPMLLPSMAFRTLIHGFSSGEVKFHGQEIYCFQELPDRHDLLKHLEVHLGFKPDLETTSFSCAC